MTQAYIKTFRILHTGGFSSNELMIQKINIHHIILDRFVEMMELLEPAVLQSAGQQFIVNSIFQQKKGTFNISLLVLLKEDVKILNSYARNALIDKNLCDLIRRIWAEKCVQDLYAKREAYQISDSLEQ